MYKSTVFEHDEENLYAKIQMSNSNKNSKEIEVIEDKEIDGTDWIYEGLQRMEINMIDMIKEKLNEKLLFFKPEIVFDETIGGIKLLIEVDAFNGHINWEVQEGNHYTYFEDFDEARDYYLEVSFGDTKE